MENFVVSARKYRPDTFASVVGQASITTTLKNAIKSHHVAQAYLFCGPRGVGKTTCARIFAKTINCQHLSDTVEACNACESCNSFNQSRAYNIHELDAASNNSVDDIRNLIDQVRVPPQIGKYSIYIIDEVHMLSSQAFNAFLKTLEEPPAHAIFIMATTEKHKILPTILSRCQIYDFNRIKIEDAVDFLANIADKESIQYEREALHVIAQKADGAMRDALSIFDQVVSFSENEMTYQKVIDNLNVLDYEYFFSITKAFLDNDVPSALLIFHEVLEKGFDAHHFIGGISEHLRNLLVCRNESTLKLLEVSESIRARYKEQVSLSSPEFLFNALKIANDCDLSYRNSNNKRLHVELALVQLCQVTLKKKRDDEVEELDDRPENTDKQEVSSSANTVAEPLPTKKKPIQKPPSISIKDRLKQTNGEKEPEKPVAEEPAVEQNVTENQEFNQDNLLEKWNEVAVQFRESEPRLYSTLTSGQPELGKGYQVSFQVDNSLQEEAILQKKSEIEIRLQRALRNGQIDLQVHVKEAKEGRKLYTDEDKFNFLKEKNATLELLKQKFNLDFE